MEMLTAVLQATKNNPRLPIIGVGGGDAPIGKMGMFDAIIAPQGWLIADGSEYNIDDYPELATHIASTHGSMNYYGGDGTTTFAVPDWQGEFFRASGTNSRTNQGDGANVGEHQNATEHKVVYGYNKATIGLFAEYGENKYDATNTTTIDHSLDSLIDGSTANLSVVASNNGNATTNSYFTSRPTNTSLLCCIKATPQGHQYSEKEQIVGSWIDGKPIYEKTIDCGAGPTASGNKNIAHGISNLGTTVKLEGVGIIPGNDWIYPVPFSSPTDLSAGITVWANATNIVLQARQDRSNSNIYITIQYTKNSD